ncbi:MAG: phosphate/phosphite/phosphonate ABC transporter substrate-binding protein [bacterium]|jgi:phosphonate transport system substrate-binding protein|nr:phosphate/phosphite/phosphonate ABC transporter substrate-binding protein [bacterium]
MTRFFIGVVLILALLVLAGVRNDSFSPIEAKFIVESPPSLVLGVIPYLSVEALKKEMDPIARYLERRLERPVKLNVCPNYRSLGKLLDLNRVHVAWFSAVSYLQLKTGEEWEVLSRPIRHDKLVYKGLIVTLADSTYHTLEDLKGTTFAYVDRNSGSGFFYPNRLFKKKGINPLTFFEKVVFTNSHDQSLHGVSNDHYAAAVYEGLILKGDKNINPQFRVITPTDSIPNDPVVVRRDLDPGLKHKLKEAMLTMHENEDGKEVMSHLKELRGVSRFVDEVEVKKSLSLPE